MRTQTRQLVVTLVGLNQLTLALSACNVPLVASESKKSCVSTTEKAENEDGFFSPMTNMFTTEDELPICGDPAPSPTPSAEPEASPSPSADPEAEAGAIGYQTGTSSTYDLLVTKYNSSGTIQ